MCLTLKHRALNEIYIRHIWLQKMEGYSNDM